MPAFNRYRWPAEGFHFASPYVALERCVMCHENNFVVFHKLQKEEIKQIVDAFISTDISEERHKKRVGKIDTIEKQYRK